MIFIYNSNSGQVANLVMNLKLSLANQLEFFVSQLQKRTTRNAIKLVVRNSFECIHGFLFPLYLLKIMTHGKLLKVFHQSDSFNDITLMLPLD